jgi:hypothetical protein
MRWILLAACLTGFCHLLSPGHRFEEGFSEEEQIGRHLAHGDGFCTPFDSRPAAAPTSWCPPVFPAVIAAVYRICGERTPMALLAIAVFNVFCRAAAAGALYLLGRLRFDPAIGVTAAILLLLHPMFLHVVDSLWDNWLALAMFLWLLVGAVWLQRNEAATWLGCALLGAGCGILLMTNTGYVLACPAIVLTPIIHRRGRGGAQRISRKPFMAIFYFAAARMSCISRDIKKPPLRSSAFKYEFSWLMAAPRRPFFALAAAAIGALLVLLPWTIRNEREFHRLFLVRGNAAVELWLGDQPWSYGWMSESVLDSHPSRNLVERQRLLEQGETQYFADCRRRFLTELTNNPRHFLLLTAARLSEIFVYDTGRSGAFFFSYDSIERCLINGFVAATGIAGMWMAWRLKRGIGLAATSLLAIGPYLATQAYNRYAMPLRAMLILYAAYVLVALWRRIAAAAAPASSPNWGDRQAEWCRREATARHPAAL